MPASLPKSAAHETSLIKAAFIDKFPNHKPIEDKPVNVEILACFDLPESYPKRVKEELEEKGFLPHLKKPDWDNVGKTVSDALNGLAWDDDSLIAKACVSKVYANKGAQLIVNIKWSDENG